MVYLRFFESQKSLYCGMHALNNIWNNYFKNNKVIFSVSDTCTEKKTINLNKICKELLNNKLKNSPSRKKKSIQNEFKCYDNGFFADEVLYKAIVDQDVHITDLSIYLKGQDPNFKSHHTTYEANHLELYLLMKNQCKTNKKIMGYLIANGKKQPSHYVCIIPKNNKLIWIDSLDSHIKNHKGYKFHKMTREEFVKKSANFFLLWQIQVPYDDSDSDVEIIS